MRDLPAFGIVSPMGHEFNDARSLAYHRAIADRVLVDPSVVDAAVKRVAAWQANGSVRAYYVEHWKRLLSLPLVDLAAKLVEPGELATAMRQVSPFAGVLTPRERWAIWHQTRSASVAL